MIHCAAGPALRAACLSELQGDPWNGELPTGEVMVTEGFNLPSVYVLHVPGPVCHYGAEQPEMLTRCYQNVLEKCKLHSIRSVAFCCISTGLFGYPADKAAQTAVAAVRQWLNRNPGVVDLVVFNAFVESDWVIYKQLLAGPLVRTSVQDALNGAETNVVVFSSPSCPYCRDAIFSLQFANVEHTVIDADNFKGELQSLTTKSSVPSCWVRSVGISEKNDGARVGDWMYVGGCNDGPLPWQGIKKLMRAGDLTNMLEFGLQDDHVKGLTILPGSVMDGQSS